MYRLKNFLVIIIFVLINANAYSLSNKIIVSKDGSGDFITIQEALNSVPVNSSERVVIFIKNGIYNEKIFIEKSNIVLIGENIDETKIIYAELRKNWREVHPDDYGSAVVNIKNNTTDILISSITIHNNYGEMFGDNDHAFAIRAGEGVTRIIIDNSKIISDGGDTVSLWNKEDGMYYHSKCYFEGWVDYVCPRGFCYIENSSFYGHNLTASIWHDGSQNEEHKFVLRNCRFDGVEGFPLGRFHRDAQFYLIDCSFTSNMADKKIFFAPSNPPRTLQWGEERIYFNNCNGDSLNYSWHNDNLNSAPDNPDPKIIDAKWTFNGKWDPVKELNEFYTQLEIQ
jgi:pectinesterase